MKKEALIIFLFALLMRIILLALSPSPFPRYGDIIRANGPQRDQVRYDQMAVNFLKGKGLNISGEQGNEGIDFRRPPGMLLWLSMIYKIFGYSPSMAMIFQIVLDSFTSFLVFLIAKIYISRKGAFFLGLIYGMFPPVASISGILLTEAPQTFCWALSIYLILRIPREKKQPIFYCQLIISSMLLGFSALLKASNIFSIMVIISILAVFIMQKKISSRMGLIAIILAMFIFILLLTPQFLWMKKKCGTFAFAASWAEHSAILGVNTVERQLFNNTEAVPEYFQVWFGLDHVLTKGLNDQDKEKLSYNDAKKGWIIQKRHSLEKRKFFLNYLKQKPLHYCAGLAYRLQLLLPRSLIAWGENFAPFSNQKYLKIKYIYLSSFTALPLLFSLIGLVSLFFYFKDLWILTISCGYIWAPYILTNAVDRHGFPAYPFFFVAISFGVTNIKRILKKSFYRSSQL
jgi:4-amino-4-deoxy-L-arabinose transferase-like glycosyltransferase